MELIDKAALIDYFRPYGHNDEPIPFETLVEYLRDSATVIDAVEVVRCKDCVNYRGGWCVGIPLNGDNLAETKPDDFCSYGHKKEGL